MKFSDLFSMRLYKEGLNRVKGFGIVAVIWSLLSSLGSPLTLLATYLIMDISTSKVIMPGELVAHMTILLLFAPLIVGRSFRFLNKRNTCDFYHSLPYKRITVYCSFFLGALTWVAAAAVIPFLLAFVLYLVFPFTTVLVGPSLLAFLAFLVCLLFLCGASALAMSMTGTAFSNFAVFCILLLEVPTLAATFKLALQAVVPVFDMSRTVLAYLTYDKFLPLMILKSGTSNTVSYDGWSVAIYAVLAVTFIVLGCLAYIRRPGEMAGTPARPAWQSVWRNCVSAPVFFVGMSMLLRVFMPGVVAQSRIYFAVAALACICAAFGAAVLYELLSAGNLRSIVRLLKHFLWLFAAGAVFVVAALGFRIGVLSKKTEKSDIVSVRFSESGNTLLDYFHTASYEDLVTQEAFYTDPELIGFVYDAYTESVAACRRGEFDTYGPVHGSLQSDHYQPVYVTIRTRHGSFTRLLRIPGLRYETMLKRKYDSDEYVKASVTLPPSRSVSSVTLSGAGNAEKIWKIFREEYEALSEAEKAAYKTDVQNSNGEWVFCFRLIGVYGGGYYENTYFVPMTFEKTMAALVADVNRQSKNGKSDLSAIRDTLQELVRRDGNMALSCTARLYDASGSSAGRIAAYLDSDEQLSEKEKAALAAVADSIDPSSQKTYTVGTPFLVVNVDTSDGSYICIVLPDAETYDLLLSQLKGSATYESTP